MEKWRSFIKSGAENVTKDFLLERSPRKRFFDENLDLSYPALVLEIESTFILVFKYTQRLHPT